MFITLDRVAAFNTFAFIFSLGLICRVRFGFLFFGRLEFLVLDIVVLEPFFCLLDGPVLHRKTQGLWDRIVPGFVFAL